jgi:glycine/D-amino acid oxidase-like deaminating enzyme
MNHSPWIEQLKRTRITEPLEENLSTDIVIIGGGIAGVSTAYFLLTETDKNIILLEANKIAHGATGHNAGQVSSDFEIPFKELIKRYGETKAVHAQKAIDIDARRLLKKIMRKANISIPYVDLLGYFGVITFDQVCADLEEIYLKSRLGISIHPMYLCDDWELLSDVPKKFLGLYVVVSRKKLNKILKSNDSSYVGVSTFLSGTLNSALFTEELLHYLVSVYKKRITVKEDSRVTKIELSKNETISYINDLSIISENIILCTNGAEDFLIQEETGNKIDYKFHQEVYGVVGFMAGYLESRPIEDSVRAYALSESKETNPYYYVTERGFEVGADPMSLVCIGGPQVFVPDRASYDHTSPYPPYVVDDIDSFTSRVYRREPSEMEFYWHGLMGYTKSGVRLVGREPKNKNLLYNLGCNGIGILTSVYGAERIAKIINNEIVEDTIFDPQ